MSPAGRLCVYYQRFFAAFAYATAHWVVGSAARLIFAAVLLPSFVTAAMSGVEPGFDGFFTIADRAYFQIFPHLASGISADPSRIPLFPYGALAGLVVYGGLFLPILIVIGWFTRLAALAMIVIIAVRTYTEATFGRLDAATMGALFDTDPGSAISDQRTLWIFLLMVLVWYGPGILSVDFVLGRWVRKQT